MNVGSVVVFDYAGLVRVAEASPTALAAALPDYQVLSGSFATDPGTTPRAAIRVVCMPQCLACGTLPPCVGDPDPLKSNLDAVAIHHDAVIGDDHIRLDGSALPRIPILEPDTDLIAALTSWRHRWGEEAQFVYHVYQLGLVPTVPALDGKCIAIPVAPNHA